MSSVIAANRSDDEDTYMWELKEPWLELVVRSAVLYGSMLALFRVSNRQGGELSPIDQVVLITVGNLAAAAALKSDDSVLAAIIAISTFVFLGMASDYLTFKSRLLRNVLEGNPKLLVHNGQLLRKSMSKETINESEIMQAIREAGLSSIADARAIILETNGKLSVIKKTDE